MRRTDRTITPCQKFVRALVTHCRTSCAIMCHGLLAGLQSIACRRRTSLGAFVAMNAGAHAARVIVFEIVKHYLLRIFSLPPRLWLCFSRHDGLALSRPTRSKCVTIMA